MTEHQLVTVDFEGDTIFAIKTPDGVFVAVKPICERLAVDWAGQLKRLKRDTVLREGMVTMTIPSVGGMQETICLPLHLIPGWLFGFEENQIRNPEAREMVLRYKRRCFLVLAAHFAPQPAAIEATVAETAPILGLEEMSARSSDFWLKMVREARVLGGDAAGRRMWARSPLPPLTQDDAAEAAFFRDPSVLQDFIAACCTVTGQSQDWVTVGLLWDAFDQWQRTEPHAAWPATTFCKRMASLAPHYICPKTGGRFEKFKSSLMGYRGLLLT